MKAQYVELIDAVATLGSLAAAAKVLVKSQPAITKALKKIEGDLGVVLFHRVPSGIVPTLEGQTVIDRCRRIQSDLKKLSEDVAQSRGQYVGMISVVVSPLAALKIIPPVLRRFQNRFPGIELNITGGHAPKAFHALRSGEADFVIGPAPDGQPKAGLHVEPLLTTSVTFLAGQQSYLEGPVKTAGPVERTMGRYRPEQPSPSFSGLLPPARSARARPCHPLRFDPQYPVRSGTVGHRLFVSIAHCGRGQGTVVRDGAACRPEHADGGYCPYLDQGKAADACGPRLCRHRSRRRPQLRSPDMNGYNLKLYP